MALFGQANKKGLLYYRHSRTNHCEKPSGYLPASLIEANVLSDIIEMFGDKPAMERAAKAAIPDIKESEELRLTVSQTEKALVKIDRDIEKILDMVVAESISKEDVKKRIGKLNESKGYLLSDYELNKTKLQSIPTKADISRRSQLLLRVKESILSSQKHLDKMTWIDKRNLLQAVFDGKDADGKRLGIYICKNKKGDRIYTINGIMGFTLTDYVRHLEPPSPEDYLTEGDYITDDKQDMCGIHAPHHCRDYHQ
jgi:uncharacterized protein YpmB